MLPHPDLTLQGLGHTSLFIPHTVHVLCVLCGTMLYDIVYNNHSPPLIYGGYLPRTCVYCGAWYAPDFASACLHCGAWSTPGTVSACYTWHMCLLHVCVMVHEAHLCLLHLAYVLAMSVLVALVVCVGYMYVLWCLEHTLCCLLHLAYVSSNFKLQDYLEVPEHASKTSSLLILFPLRIQ